MDDLAAYVIIIFMVASAFFGYLMVRAKDVERDMTKTFHFMYLTVFCTIVWMVVLLFS